MYELTNVNSSPFTNIAGTGTSGLQNGIGTGTGFDANRIAAGLPINFFQANPALAQGNAYLETNGGQHPLQRAADRAAPPDEPGIARPGQLQYAFGRQTWRQHSLRDDWYYIPSTGNPDHAFKLNWVYELPFGQGKKWGSGAGGLMNALIGGWEWTASPASRPVRSSTMAASAWSG